MLNIISHQRNTHLSYTEILILVFSNGTAKIKTNNLNVGSDVEKHKFSYFAGRSKMVQTLWKMAW